MINLKRPDLILNAFAEIAPQRPDWDLLMIGEGPLRPQLAASIPQTLQQRVTWTGFLDDQPLISALYRASDVLVLPSHLEPWGIVITEAAAAGLAMVASHTVGAAHELIHDHTNGRIFPAGDQHEITRCLWDVTDLARTDAMKRASLTLFAAWREQSDPIHGLRQALRSTGTLA